MLKRLVKQLEGSGSCAESPNVTLCLAIGKIAERSDGTGLARHFKANGWGLFDVEWVRERLRQAAKRGYENDVAFVVSKILLRDGSLLSGSNDTNYHKPSFRTRKIYNQ